MKNKACVHACVLGIWWMHAMASASVSGNDFALWVVHSHDNKELPFIVIDKHRARALLFGADGIPRGTAPALLGLAVGDDSMEGIGDKPLANIAPHERTTPAGRFVVEWGFNLKSEEILWIDYDLALALHPVTTDNAKDQRLQRLASPSVLDNRISYGCINVPKDFYHHSVLPLGRNAIVYILPEVKAIDRVFSSFYHVKKQD